MRVYIAGPYTRGDTGWNVSQAMTAAHRLLNFGHAPYVPHLNHFLHLLHARSYEDWMELDMAWLAMAEALIRLPGDSPGADKEVAYARDHHILVYQSVDQFLEVERERLRGKLNEQETPQAGRNQ